MAYRLSGTYVAHCDCQQLCPCAVDGPPTGKDGQCRGLLVFGIKDGTLDDTDLSGVNVAMGYMAPSNISSGNLRLGIVVDEGASDDQADALERIFRGDEGGMFGQFAPLIGEWLGVERAKVELSDGDRPKGTVGDSSFGFEPLEGPDGTHTTVKSAMFGFAPEFRVGKAPGSSDRFGIGFDGTYGETADFEFGSEMPEEAPKGRV